MPTAEIRRARLAAYGTIVIFCIFATCVETLWNATRHATSAADRAELREELAINRTYMVRQTNDLAELRARIARLEERLARPR